MTSLLHLRNSFLPVFAAGVCFAAFTSTAEAKPKKKQPIEAAPAPDPVAPDEPVDIASVRASMKVVTDGKKHYLVVAPYNSGKGGVYNGYSDKPGLFSGDGKTFYSQRSPAGGSRAAGGSRKEDSYWFMFWDPRSRKANQALYEFEKGKHVLSCGDRKTELQAVPDAEAQAMIDGAKFVKPLWKRRPYWLARDEHARYYYVDVMREPEQNKSFRLFVGPKGNLKQQKMTNVVSDSKGDIFSTKAGELRLITQETEANWFEGKTKLPLTIVPVEDNAQLVYSELGVYAGERLGTPCDDM